MCLERPIQGHNEAEEPFSSQYSSLRGRQGCGAAASTFSPLLMLFKRVSFSGRPSCHLVFTMILQQSATFERKSDGAIAIQCSVCFFSGFSTCHCSSQSTSSNVGKKKTLVKRVICDTRTTAETPASAEPNNAERFKIPAIVMKLDEALTLRSGTC